MFSSHKLLLCGILSLILASINAGAFLLCRCRKKLCCSNLLTSALVDCAKASSMCSDFPPFTADLIESKINEREQPKSFKIHYLSVDVPSSVRQLEKIRYDSRFTVLQNVSSSVRQSERIQHRSRFTICFLMSHTAWDIWPSQFVCWKQCPSHTFHGYSAMISVTREVC